MKNINKNTSFITFLASGLRPRKLSTSLAIAKAVADTLLIPSSDISDYDDFYNVSCANVVGSTLSIFNELVSLDIDTILSYTRKFWKVRVMSVYPPKRIFTSVAKDTPFIVFNIAAEFSKDDNRAMYVDYLDFFEIYNNVRELLGSEFTQESISGTKLVRKEPTESIQLTHEGVFSMPEKDTKKERKELKEKQEQLKRICIQHHINTFNIDAAAKNVELRAQVPLKQTINGMSVDLTICDKQGNVHQAYHVKIASEDTPDDSPACTFILLYDIKKDKKYHG